MKDLANYYHRCIDIENEIREELIRCEIDIVEGEKYEGVLQSRISGKLGDFRLSRGKYYWIVVGKIPIKLAIKLYQSHIGHRDIRVNGDCGSTPPDEKQQTWFTPGGKEILSKEQERETYKEIGSSPVLKKLWEDNKHRYIFSDNKESLGNGYITMYHIDSELGLYIFVNAIKEAGLITN